jgi:oligoribonuclease NrnB/cAMP/cGMP phosphodiesterase (DHH superfamily)
MKCFYHGVDFDGKCSGAIVKLKYPNCELIGIDYGDPFPWDMIHDDEVLFMVDFAIQPHVDMERLYAKTGGKLVWIDHHKTALEWAGLSGFDNVCKGVRSPELAGCELTWRYLHGGDEFPRAVALLGRYDVWDHQHPQTLPFQFGMRLAENPPEDTAWWHDLFTREQAVLDIIETGHICQAYAEQSHAGVCKMAGFDLEWEGLRWTAVNGPYRGSMVHKSRFDHERHDAMLGFYWTGKQWTLSLTTDKPGIDVSAIAKKYGGGGHKGAAGFQANNLPFALVRKTP